MKNGNVPEVFVRDSLSAEDLADIRALAKICERHEGLHLRLMWQFSDDILQEKVRTFLYYQDGQLIGFLGMFEITIQAVVVGMVHPGYRRKGIFTFLLDTARMECRFLGVLRFIFVCEEASYGGQAFMRRVGAQLNFSRYRMVLKNFYPRWQIDERVSVSQASNADLDDMVSIMVQGFQNSADVIQERLKACLSDKYWSVYLARFGEGKVSCREPLGMLRVKERQDERGIYGFVIMPGYQNRGYGRQILEETIRDLQEQSLKSIMLEVETDNDRAFHLYKSVGFVTQTTYDFFVWELSD